LLGHGDSLPQPKDLFSTTIFISFHVALTEENKSVRNEELAVMQTIVQRFKSVQLVSSLSSEMFLRRVCSTSPEFEADFKILNLFFDTLKIVDCHQDLITRSKPELQGKFSQCRSSAKLQKPQVAHEAHPLRPSVIRRNILPVEKRKPQILQLVDRHQIVCIEGETGSGKSSKIPQFILDEAAYCNKRCKILVSQPNSITAIRLAQRVSHERQEDVGKTVGYRIDSELYKVSLSDTKIIYCTREYAREYILQVRCTICEV